MKKKITTEVVLTDSQLALLEKLSTDNDDGFEDWAGNHSDKEDDDMLVLINKGLAESVVGEQFYITDLGKKFLS